MRAGTEQRAAGKCSPAPAAAAPATAPAGKGERLSGRALRRDLFKNDAYTAFKKSGSFLDPISKHFPTQLC